MKKIKIASVTLLIIRKVRILVVVDTYNKVCKFHIDYPASLEKNAVDELQDKVKEFAISQLGDAEPLLPVEFTETSKEEVFQYLPSKFC